MSTNDATLRKFLSRDLTETLIRVGLIAFLVVMCIRVFAPFAGLVVWGLILAIALEPLHGRLAARLGGRQGLDAEAADVKHGKTKNPPVVIVRAEVQR